VVIRGNDGDENIKGEIACINFTQDKIKNLSKYVTLQRKGYDQQI
jgi:hypothetical protein